MATNVIMPKLGMTMTEGTIIKWHKKVGDVIEEGMPLFDVETDKLTNTVNANVSGTLLKISVPEDGTADYDHLKGHFYAIIWLLADFLRLRFRFPGIFYDPPMFAYVSASPHERTSGMTLAYKYTTF